jgi:hypothetical protein
MFASYASVIKEYKNILKVKIEEMSNENNLVMQKRWLSFYDNQVHEETKFQYEITKIRLRSKAGLHLVSRPWDPRGNYMKKAFYFFLWMHLSLFHTFE